MRWPGHNLQLDLSANTRHHAVRKLPAAGLPRKINLGRKGAFMKRSILTILLLLAATSAGYPCSLCQLAVKDQRTLREDMMQARLILFGHIANPRFINDQLGTGVTDFHIEKVLKHNDALNVKVLALERYIPVLDEKSPPRFVMFCDIVGGKLDPYRGRSVQTAAFLDYVKGVEEIKNRDRTEQLLFYFRHLDAADDAIAEDAFLEFARSSDREVGDITRHLEPARLRRLLGDPKTSTDRLSLFAFLLGGCGGDADAQLLRKLIDQPGRDDRNLDGLLSGYIHLRPADGWDLTYTILADRERPFLEQYAAMRTLRLYQGWRPDDVRPHVLRCCKVVVEDGEIADLAIEDLRRWQIWELTPTVLAQYTSPAHKAPITRRAIVRYALSCPLPDARRFVAQLEQQPDQRDLLRDLREGLDVERKEK